MASGGPYGPGGDDTPTKISFKGCCTCGEPKNHKMIHIHGKVGKSNQIVEKIQRLLSPNIILLEDSLICNKCIGKLNNSIRFISCIEENIDISKVRSSIPKRGHHSPHSIPTQAHSQISSTSPTKIPVRKKIRRRLIDGQEASVPVALASPIPEMDSLTVNDLSPTTRDHDEAHQQDRESHVMADHSYPTCDPLTFSMNTPLAIIQHHIDSLQSSSIHLPDLKTEIDKIVSKRKGGKESVFIKYRKVDELVHADSFIGEMIMELHAKCPTVLNVLITLCSPKKGGTPEKLLGPIATMYGIAIHQVDNNQSAFQRLMTMLCIRGDADDMLITRLQKLGITLGARRKLDIMEECPTVSREHIIKDLRVNQHIKITGDNLDIRIKTEQTSEKSHKSLHLFTSNLIFSRIPNKLDECSQIQPEVHVDNITPEQLLMSNAQSEELKTSYKILLARIFAKHVPALKWMKKITPLHIEHEFSEEFSQSSKIYPLKLQFKNEASYDDCCDIMDDYEEDIVGFHMEAFGSTERLKQKKCIVGGDQLTRVRLQGAKRLRALSPNPMKRFDHLEPIVFELWHNKQDFVHKAYKALYNEKSNDVQGTLYFFKTILRRTDVNGNVKSNFQAHQDLLLEVAEMMFVEQLLEYLGINTLKDRPSVDLIPQNISDLPIEAQTEVFNRLLEGFLSHYDYGKFNMNNQPKLPGERRESTQVQMHTLPNGRFKLVRVQISLPPDPYDELLNYSSNLCHWALHLLSLNDTAKEGDVVRTQLNCRYNIPFFFSHSTLSKYFRENIIYLLQTNFILSPQMSLRVQEGGFANEKGGRGKNVEEDLVQEHSVRVRKTAIRNLGSNKSEKAMLRTTSAADTISKTIASMDLVLDVKTPSTKHTRPSKDTDMDKIHKVLRQVRPFRISLGRKCEGFNKIPKSPLDKVDRSELKRFMSLTIDRTCRGIPQQYHLSDSDSDGDEQ